MQTLDWIYEAPKIITCGNLVRVDGTDIDFPCLRPSGHEGLCNPYGKSERWKDRINEYLCTHCEEQEFVKGYHATIYYHLHEDEMFRVVMDKCPMGYWSYPMNMSCPADLTLMHRSHIIELINAANNHNRSFVITRRLNDGVHCDVLYVRGQRDWGVE